MKKRTALVAIVGLVTASAVSGTAATSRAAADPAPSVTVERSSSGMLVQTVTDGDFEIVTYGVTAPEVAIDPSAVNEAEVSIDVPTGLPEEYRAGGDQVAPTVYEMSLAAGLSPSEACEFAQDMDPYGCATSATIENRRNGRPTMDGPPRSDIYPEPDYDPSSDPLADPSYDPGVNPETGEEFGEELDDDVEDEYGNKSLISATCFDYKVTKGDGTKYNHACATRYLDYSGSFKLIGSKMKATGWQKGGGWYNDSIMGVGVQLRYSHDDAYAVDYDPYSSEPVGSCNETTTSVSSPKTGAEYSSSATVCPERLSPWHSPAFQYFGAKWTGEQAPEDESRGVVAASVVRVPKGGTNAATIQAWLKWG